MSIIAYGAEKVQALEYALAGRPPARAGKEPLAQLQQFVAERFKSLTAAREENARLTAGIRDRMFGHIAKDDPAMKRGLADTRKAYERRLKGKIRLPDLTKIEPRFVTGSAFWLKAPPYDNAWRWTAGTSTAGADKTAGSYTMATQSIGDGSCEAAAGVAVWFHCTTTDPMQRVAALLDYADDWWDSASGYVAHNDLRTRIWVWGHTEQKWVGRSDLSPSWSDGVGWFESHGNDPSGDSGRTSIETFFPADANNWYQAWIWSDASVYADGGMFGIAASSIQFSAQIPFVVFGSLF